MSTRKYTLIILAGLFILSILGGSFIYFYAKKTQNTNSLVAIPTDVAALIRVNQPGIFLSTDSTQTLFEGVENSSLKNFLHGISNSKEFGKILNNPILISFHPIGKNLLEPLIILNSNEEFSNHKINKILQVSDYNIKPIDYNGTPIYACVQNDGKTFYAFHLKGLTAISPSLILCESSIRKIESEYPIEADLLAAYNLTSSSSDASIAINTKAISPWLQNNLFASTLNLAQVSDDLCKWLIVDYQQGVNEVAISGMLTTTPETIAGNSLLTAQVGELLTPSLITENTAFCLERNLGDIRDFLKRLTAKDSTKYTLQGLALAINPNKAIIEHIRNRQTDSSGFVVLLYPTNMDSTLAELEQNPKTRSYKQSVISKLEFDTTNVSMAKILGATFQPIKPSYIYIDDEKVVLSEKESTISTFLNEQTIVGMRKNNPVNDIWKNKITSTGVAAIYFNPNFSNTFINTIFNGTTKRIFASNTFSGWNGLGIMLTPNGSNLLLSGYISRREEAETMPSYSIRLGNSSYKKTYVTLSNGKSLLALLKNDSLTAINGKLEKIWKIKVDGKPDSIFTIKIGGKELIGLSSKDLLLFYNERGEKTCNHNFGNSTTIATSALKTSPNNLVVVDNNRNVFLVNPLKNEEPQKLFRLGYTPNNITYATVQKKDFLLIGRNGKTEVLNFKGGVVRRVPFDMRNGKAIVLEKKVVLFNSDKSMVVSPQFVPQKDELSNNLKSISEIYDGHIGNMGALLLVKDNKITLSSRDLLEKHELKTSSQPVFIRTLNGHLKGVLVIDDRNNLYLFDSKGELCSGYPHNLRKASAVLTMDDGTLFAVTFTDNTLESRQIVANFPSIL